MSLGKSNIISNICTKALISRVNSSSILEAFLFLLKNKSKDSDVKLSGFGSFYTHNSPKRVGRNPKTKDEYEISARSIIKFRASNKVKGIIN